jgi:anion-transporting  ArsA/GET3 family ATPase
MLNDKRLIVCCGSGGVGKTTVSAAIGVQAALVGKKALVLTIDPAKRLAGALGLETLTPRPQLINLKRRAKGSLHAAQLDPKQTFDGIIERFAPDEETRKTILKNPLYKHLSSMIAGSQEYMAMEKLYELSREESWDILVLDTPPARNAMDFLDAPQRMVRAITDSFLKYFVRPSVYAGRIGNRALNMISARFEKTLGRFAGVQFIHEVFDLVSATVSLLDGFRDRATSTEEILKQDTTTFLLITSPRPAAIADANGFFQRFKKHHLPLGGCIINRVHPSFAKDIDYLAEMRDHAVSKGEKIALALVENAMRYQRLHEVDEHEIDLLKGVIPICRSIPLFPQDVCDIKGLEKINQHLFGESPQGD